MATTAVQEEARPTPAADAGPVPYAAYASIAAAFAAILQLTDALERARARRAHPATVTDLAVLAAATFKAARVVSRERLGRVVREPLVETVGLPEAGLERPAGTGLRRALGELVTCSRCTGTWAAAALVATEAAVPGFGSLLRWTLAASAANDFLQAGFAGLCDRNPRSTT